MEGYGVGLSPTNDSWCRLGLSWALPFGFIVTALFTAFEIKANHVQMTYYYLFIILFMVIGYLVKSIREKQLAVFLKATGVLAAAALIGIAINLSSLYHTWQYQKESMRGKSELVKKDAANQTSSGLDRDYITQWSYGIDETLTLLVPDAKGGASVPLSKNATAMAKADPTDSVYDTTTLRCLSTVFWYTTGYERSCLLWVLSCFSSLS